MAFVKTSAVALFSTLLLRQSLAQSASINTNGCSGILIDDHCCPGSIIGYGSSSVTCCAGDPKLDFINAQGQVSIDGSIIGGSIDGNDQSVGNILQGPSTCTAGTSTAFSSLPSTASSNGGSSGTASSSGATTTETNGSQVCVTTTEGGSVSQQCHGTGNQGSGSGSDGSDSGNGNIISSGASSGDSGSNSVSVAAPSSTTSENAAWKPVATAAPLLAGAMVGVVALL